MDAAPAEATPDWRDVADDVRAWIEATKPSKSHFRWANQARKKPVAHWRSIIAEDAGYQPTLAALGAAASSTVDEQSPETSGTPGTPGPSGTSQPEQADATLTASVKRKRKMPVITRDSFAAVKKKQRDRLDAANARDATESEASRAARASAVARTSMLGAAAAQEAGAIASAHVGASERLSVEGMGSIRPPCKPSHGAELLLPERHKDVYAAAMARAGVHELNSNPLGLHDGMYAEDILRAIQQSNPQTAATFGLLSTASSSSFGVSTFSSLASDSLDAMPSAVDAVDHLRAMQEALNAR
jgi:hypothetical protein